MNNNKQIGGTHYIDQPVQPWDVIDTWSLEQQIGYYRGNALKYIMRLGNKDMSITDTKKAQHYCEKLAQALSNDRS